MTDFVFSVFSRRDPPQMTVVYAARIAAGMAGLVYARRRITMDAGAHNSMNRSMPPLDLDTTISAFTMGCEGPENAAIRFSGNGILEKGFGGAIGCFSHRLDPLLGALTPAQIERAIHRVSADGRSPYAGRLFPACNVMEFGKDGSAIPQSPVKAVVLKFALPETVRQPLGVTLAGEAMCPRSIPGQQVHRPGVAANENVRPHAAFSDDWRQA